MAFDELMSRTDEMLRQAQALAAMTARLRLRELGEPGDPAVTAQLDRVAEVLGVKEQHDELDDQQRAVLISLARSYLRQAVDLVEDPGRTGAWTHTDPTILQTQGRASGLIAMLLAESGFGAPGARILDVGSGVAGLSIAFCEHFPDSTVVGVDPWEPALELARANVDEAGLGSRITLVPGRIEELSDTEGFDLAWLPTFFIPEAVLDDVLSRVREMMRPGGATVLGVFEAPADPLAAAVDDVFTVRSGGAVIGPDDAVARLERAGFVDARQVERTWNAPVLLVVGHNG